MRSDRWAMRILFLDCSPSTKEGADAARRFVMARPDFPHNSARIGGLSRTSKECQGLNRNPKLPSSPQQLRQPTPLNAPTDKRWVAPIALTNVQGTPRTQQKTQASHLTPTTQTAHTTQGRIWQKVGGTDCTHERPRNAKDSTENPSFPPRPNNPNSPHHSRQQLTKGGWHRLQHQHLGGLSRTSKECQGLNRKPKLPTSPQQPKQPKPLKAATDKRWVAPIAKGGWHQSQKVGGTDCMVLEMMSVKRKRRKPFGEPSYRGGGREGDRTRYAATIRRI